MIVLRVFIALLLIAIAAVGAIPLLLLLDLVGGGDGWGICPDGLGSCRTSYFDGPELLVFLAIVLFVLLAILRLAVLLQRKLDRDRERRQQRWVGGPPPGNGGIPGSKLPGPADDEGRPMGRVERMQQTR